MSDSSPLTDRQLVSHIPIVNVVLMATILGIKEDVEKKSTAGFSIFTVTQ